MKLLNSVKLTVFVKEGEDLIAIKETFLKLIPFDIEQEKLSLLEINASGFNEGKIKIIELQLLKEKHTNQFIKNLMSKFSSEQKALLLRQFYSRCDSEFNFFIRVDKEKLLNNEYFITDSGNCYHIKMNLACFPRNIDAAKALVEKILG
jgi:RNA binding exosome subunit